jgi:hypothetical protein
MSKPRLQFKVKGLLIAVALLAGALSFLRPFAIDGAPVIEVFGPAEFGQDGSVTVRGGSVRIIRGREKTEVRANRIVIRKDDTVEVDGRGTIVQTTR